MKNNKLTYAHMAPHELDVLDHLQGAREVNKKNKVRSYQPLEHLLKNPHIRKKIMQMAEQHRANGGQIQNQHGEVEDADERAHAANGLHGDDLNKTRLTHLLLQKMRIAPDKMTEEELDFLKSQGHHGDTEMAAIGPHTHSFLDKMAGHKTHNPDTGMPEYWSLKSALGGLWDGVKGAARSAGSYAKEKAGEAFGAAKNYAKEEGPGILRGFAHEVAPHIGKAINSKVGNYFGKDSVLGGGVQALTNAGTRGVQGLAEKGGMNNAGRVLGGGLAGAARNKSLGDGMITAGRTANKLDMPNASGALLNAGKTRRDGGSFMHQATNGYRGATNQSPLNRRDYQAGQGLKQSLSQGAGHGIHEMLRGDVSMRQAARTGLAQAANNYGAKRMPLKPQERHQPDPARQLPYEPNYDTGNMFNEE